MKKKQVLDKGGEAALCHIQANRNFYREVLGIKELPSEETIVCKLGHGPPKDWLSLLRVENLKTTGNHPLPHKTSIENAHRSEALYDYMVGGERLRTQNIIRDAQSNPVAASITSMAAARQTALQQIS